ncbi:MAG: cell division protein ZapD [Gammaproteobacteria bacterium]|nr:cell division protein ZapD [Gammaproteobacteria bacterium]
MDLTIVTAENIIFEQPLNEHIRVCLRMEFLFQQLAHFMQLDSPWDSRISLNSILEILSLADRPDLKNKLAQALHQYLAALTQLEDAAQVDKQKLSHTLTILDDLIDKLNSFSSRFGQELRDSEFLMSIAPRLYTPAGTCGFSAPAYYLWLEQPAEIRKEQILNWSTPLALLKDIVDFLLKLTRQSGSLKSTIAANGFYQANLDQNILYQMIRIELPKPLNLYPEISVGRHRLTIHFFELDPFDRAKQTKHEVKFGLKCCRL